MPPPPRHPSQVSTPSRAPSAPPTPAATATADSTALYDFEAQADDELSVTEGERLVFIEGGSDDPDWVKCRRADGSAQEGVVPATYVQRDGDEADGGADDADAEEAARRAAEDEAEAAQAAEDERRLQEQIAADARAADEREARLRSQRETKHAGRREREKREKRMSNMPPAAPIPVPRPGDEDHDAPPPQLAARPSASQIEGSSSGSGQRRHRDKGDVKYPEKHRVRTWRDRTGQFKVEAEFLGMKGQKVCLHKLNGVIVDVPIAKMSAEDTQYLERLQSRQDKANASDHQPATKSERHHHKSSRHHRERNGDAAPPQAAAPRPQKKQTDWFDFFLTAGCDPDDCTRYAANFERDRIEEDVLDDLEPATLRSLGLREGDVLRVKKLIKEKYVPPPTPDKSEREKAQIASDAELARKLQGGPSPPPPPNLFTSANGALKTTRRGRPASNRQVSSTIDEASLASAGSKIAERSGTPAESSSKSPAPQPSLSSGFDDDAWSVPKEPAKAVSPASEKPASPAPAPPPAPAASAPPPASSPAPAAPAPSSAQSYNDALLAQLGIGAKPNSPQPMPARASPAPPAGSPGPRGPLAPVPQNQGLLNPLVPTNTANYGFLPTSRQGSMVASPTGMVSSPTGMPGMMPQATGMMPQATGMMPQSTGMMMPPQQTGMMPQHTAMPMQPQPTGFAQSAVSMPMMSAPMSMPMMSREFSSSLFACHRG